MADKINYSVTIDCGNCGFKNIPLIIMLMKTVKEHAGYTRCPNCQCMLTEYTISQPQSQTKGK